MSFCNLDDPQLNATPSSKKSAFRKPTGDEVLTLDFVIWFGRYADYTIDQVIPLDYKYLLWACEHVAAFKTIDRTALDKIIAAQDKDDDEKFGQLFPDDSTYTDI